MPLPHGLQRDIFAAMRIGPLSTVDFVCMNCQLPHRATRQQSTEQLSGSFECEECHQPVHGWTGFEDFFDWHPIRMQPIRPGTKMWPLNAPGTPPKPPNW